MVPNGWKFGFLSEFVQINPSVKIDKNTIYPFIEMDAVPFDGKKASYINMRMGSEAGMKFKRFDTLLARITPSAENGKAMYVTDNIDIGIGSTEFIVFRPKKDVTDNTYVFYLVTSDLVRPKSIALMEGTSGRQRIPNSIYTDKIKILLPSDIAEQRKIATILSTLDRTIEATQKLIDKEKMIKKGLMADLLTNGIDEQGRIRSPQTHTYVDSPLGMIPEEWEVVELQENFEYISYGFTNPMPTTEIGPFMVTATDIKNGQISYQTCRKTSQEAYDNLLTKKSKPIKNDILLTKDGSLGRIALMDDVVVCINQSVALLRPKKSQNPIFLKHLLESPMYQKKMLHDAGGSTIKHIYITVLDKMKIMKPIQSNEQNQIAAILSAQDRKIKTEETNLVKLQNLKKGLMGDLLSGKVRVKG